MSSTGTIITNEDINQSLGSVPSLDEYRNKKFGSSNVIEETISHVDTYTAIYEAKDTSKTFNLKFPVNANEKVKISLSRKTRHEEFHETNHSDSENYHNLREQNSNLSIKNESLTAQNNLYLDIIEGLRHTNDELINQKVKGEAKMDRLQMKLKYFKFYSFIWGFSAFLALIFIILGIIGTLSTFPAISGLLATMVGVAGAYLDWKDRVKTYDS